MKDSEGSSGFENGSLREPDAASAQQLLSALAHPRRRAILRSLASRKDSGIQFEVLVDDVIQRLADSKERCVLDRKNVAISINHTHLPKLQRIGLVEKDGNRFRSSDVSAVTEILATVESRERHRGTE